MENTTKSVNTVPAAKKSVRFVVELILPMSQGSMLGKSKTANLTEEQKLARFYLNAVIKRGGKLISEDAV